MKVFLADDSNSFVERLTTQLADLPQVELVGRAGDVQGALRGIRDLAPDAVIVDLHMPGGTGIDIIDAAKRLRSATMVIVLTNSSYPQYRAKCEAAGADAFFDKSTEFDRLPQALVEPSKEFHKEPRATLVNQRALLRAASRAGGRPPENCRGGDICPRMPHPLRGRPNVSSHQRQPFRAAPFPRRARKM
jgi:CheY-like chemotaxis protein